jgi:hypothetical protein
MFLVKVLNPSLAKNYLKAKERRIMETQIFHHAKI